MCVTSNGGYTDAFTWRKWGYLYEILSDLFIPSVLKRQSEERRLRDLTHELQIRRNFSLGATVRGQTLGSPAQKNRRLAVVFAAWTAIEKRITSAHKEHPVFPPTAIAFFRGGEFCQLSSSAVLVYYRFVRLLLRSLSRGQVSRKMQSRCSRARGYRGLCPGVN